MKKALLFTAALGLVSSMSAQMQDNRICPNWTGTDLNGNTHTLYDYLDQGYTVLLDVSATWCGPCWNYHTGHTLRTIYETYGPGTSYDKVMVIFIEGDGSTTLADLNGTTSASQGDWVTGTPYPIIDDASIADLLEIAYFPTLYRVCPNRMITEPGQLGVAAMWAACQACDKYEADTSNDGSVLPNVDSDVVCAGTPVDLHIRLQNTGTATLTSANIEATVGTTVVGSTTWSGSLDTYELEDVNVGSYTPSAGTNTIRYSITSTDDEPTNNTANATAVTSSTVMNSLQVELELKTDNYPSETKWKLYDGAGTVIDQDPAGNYAAATVYTENWTLNNDECYRFEITDAAGDGICCDYGVGYYKLKVNGTAVVNAGEFGSIEVTPFLVQGAIGIEENVLDRGLAIFPNPTNGSLNVKMDLPSATLVNISVMNLVGEVVSQQAKGFGAGAQQTTLDLSDLAQGSYFVNILADGMTATRKVTITK